MKVKRHPALGLIEVSRGGGCLGGIGILFALQSAAIGTFLVMGWRAGDIPNEITFGGLIIVGAFFLCGLGLATFRERFCFDTSRESLTQSRHLYFLRYWQRLWSMQDFEAVELSWVCRPSRNYGGEVWVQAIRLLPRIGDARSSDEPLQIVSDEPGKRMQSLAQEIADVCRLPLRQPPKATNIEGDP